MDVLFYFPDRSSSSVFYKTNRDNLIKRHMTFNHLNIQTNKPSIYSQTYMDLNEPVHQDGTCGVSEMPGQVSVGKRVLCLSSLQGETRKQEAHTKYLKRYSAISVCANLLGCPPLYTISDWVCIQRILGIICSYLKEKIRNIR